MLLLPLGKGWGEGLAEACKLDLFVPGCVDAGEEGLGVSCVSKPSL